MSVFRWKCAAAAAAAVLTAAAYSGSALPLTAGAKEIAEPALSMSLIAGGSVIGMNIYINLPAGETLSDCTVTFDGESASLTSTDNGYLLTASEYAMNMTKEHTVQVTAKDGSYDIVKTVSVKSYLDSIANDESCGALAKSMMMYGGAAQTFFNVNTDALASDSVTGADYSDVQISAPELDKTALTAALENTPVTYYGMNLSLRSETAFNLYFGIAEGADQESALDYLKELSFGGNAASVKANGTDFAEVSLNIPATALTKTYTLEGDGISADFCPAQYLSAAAAGTDSALADVCKALYAYGDAAASYTPGSQTESKPKSDALSSVSATATTYSNPVGSAHLEDYVSAHDAYVVALTDDDYNKYVGGMIEVTYGSKSVNALVTNIMKLSAHPNRNPGDIDLITDAFTKLTGNTTGIYDITWRLVPNSYAENSKVQYYFETGKIYYMKIQPRNTVYPVAKFEYKIGDGNYTEVPKTDDNCYEIDNPGTDVLSFRMTDIFGETIEESDLNTGMTETEVHDVVVNGTVQFTK